MYHCLETINPSNSISPVDKRPHKGHLTPLFPITSAPTSDPCATATHAEEWGFSFVVLFTDRSTLTRVSVWGKIINNHRMALCQGQLRMFTILRTLCVLQSTWSCGCGGEIRFRIPCSSLRQWKMGVLQWQHLQAWSMLDLKKTKNEKRSVLPQIQLNQFVRIFIC